MDNPTIVGFLVLLALLFVVFVCVLAYRRGRSVMGAWILCFTLTPFIALGLVLLFGPDHVVLAKRKTESAH